MPLQAVPVTVVANEADRRTAATSRRPPASLPASASTRISIPFPQVHPHGKEPKSNKARTGPDRAFHINQDRAGFHRLYIQVASMARVAFAAFAIEDLPDSLFFPDAKIGKPASVESEGYGLTCRMPLARTTIWPRCPLWPLASRLLASPASPASCDDALTREHLCR
jgi:hypothetical protein